MNQRPCVDRYKRQFTSQTLEILYYIQLISVSAFLRCGAETCDLLRTARLASVSLLAYLCQR